MCHICVIDGVKARLDRRGFFKAAAVSAAAVAVSALPAAAQERTIPFKQVIDLTHTLTPDFPTYFGTAAFKREPMFTYAKDKLNLDTMTYAEHIGTHFDAPIHFSADGLTVDQITIDKLVCPLAVVDVRAKADADIDYRLTPDDLKAFEAQHGRIPDGACVAMNSGWEANLGTPKFRGEDGAKTLHFPGFHVEAVDFLMKERQVNGIAVDTLSLDHGPSKDSAVHYAWLPSGRYGIENVANLSLLPPIGATLVAGAPKFKGGTGGPGRVMAFI